MNYDLIVIGSGPGGYVAAIRASQLGMKVAVVERAEIGGICLNWGCIPTKSLLKSAQVYDYIKHAEQYGIKVGEYKADFKEIIARSRGIAEQMSKGVQYLFKKNKIDMIQGFGKIAGENTVELTAAQTRAYIRGEDLELSPDTLKRATDGYVLLKYKSEPVACGLLKGNVVKNVLPKASRLRIEFL